MSILCGFNNNNETVFIDDAVKGEDTVYCFDCKEELVSKKGSIRIHHFAHKAVSNCSGESWEHKYGKEFIRRNIDKIMLRNICIKCNDEYDGDFGGCYVLLEKGYKGYILDCAVYDENKRLCDVVEIYFTHKTEIEKIDTILSSDIGYYEIDANSIINNTDKDVFKNMYKKFVCDKCEENIKEKEKEKTIKKREKTVSTGVMCGKNCKKCKKKYWIENKLGYSIWCCVSCRVDCDKCINDTHFKRL